MALIAEVTEVKMLSLDEGTAEITVAYKQDGTTIAVRQFRIDVNRAWNAETRQSMLDKIKNVGLEIHRSLARHATIQNNLVGQTITLIP